MDRLENVSWRIVEQKHFAEVGKKEFQDSKLKFYYDIDECFTQQNPNVLILSNVLQYLEKPYDLLDEILKNDFDFVLVDRTTFSRKGVDEIKLQVVNPNIYDASYPCWFLNFGNLLTYFREKGYRLVETFDSFEVKSKEFCFSGMILQKIHTAPAH